MKTPLRIAVLTLTAILFVITYYTHNDPYATSLPSRLLVRSRGYLPQALLGWDSNRTCSTSGRTGYGLVSSEQEEEDVMVQDEVDTNPEVFEEVIEEVVVVQVEEEQEQEQEQEQESEQAEEEEQEEYQPQYTQPSPGQGDKIVIMGKMSDEYTDWVEKELPDWQRAIYHVDYHNQTHLYSNLTSFASSLPPSHYPTPNGLNKGREALPYLTYIIDNYYSPHLPSILAFVHPHRDGYPRAWHTDSPGHSMPTALKALKTEYIQETGYANLRCNLDVGCPAEVRPLSPSPTKEPEAHMAAVWPAIFPNLADQIPEVIAAPCCAQFAVSRDAVLARPLEDYVRVRQWLVDSELSDYITGRVMEYIWHILFRPEGADTVLCPDMATCYCRLYGRMCGRGRASGFGKIAAAPGAAKAVVGGHNGPPAGVQGKKWFPQQEHGSVLTRQAKQEEEKAKSAEVEERETKVVVDVPLPPSPVETPEEVEEGELAALAKADGNVAKDPIAYAKSRIAAHNDLANAKAMIMAASEANPAGSSES